MQIKYGIIFISLFGTANCLTCISSDSGHVTCSNNDYCVYFSGTSEGTSVEYQGCAADLDAETQVTVCTGDEYTQGTENGEKYTIQCCSTNNCNTGKESSSGNNRLECLTTSGNHKTCASNDHYCAYLSGTYQGTKTLFQGCSADLSTQTGITACTGNEFTHGSTNDDTYTLQCCDTNNCNTGKDGSNGTNTVITNFSLEFIILFIVVNSLNFMPF